MINARNTTLNQRPKPFNSIGVDMFTNVFFGTMLNAFIEAVAASEDSQRADSQKSSLIGEI